MAAHYQGNFCQHVKYVVPHSYWRVYNPIINASFDQGKKELKYEKTIYSLTGNEILIQDFLLKESCLPQAMESFSYEWETYYTVS